MWGCKPHWLRLPKWLRDAIWETYKPGQEIDLTPSEAYLKVAHEVQVWIRQHYPNEVRRETAMVMKQGTSLLAQKLGDAGRQAFDEVKGKEIEWDTGGNLPAGIDNGIAQLIEMKFDVIADGKDNAGKLYYYAAATVLFPKEHKGAPIEGKRTKQFESIFDTPGKSRETVKEHLHFATNQMKMLGANLAGAQLHELDTIAATLVKMGPCFSFRTWKGKKQVISQIPGSTQWGLFNEDDNGNKTQIAGKAWPSQAAATAANPYAGRDPMVNEVWGGIVAYSPTNGQLAGGAVDDSTPAAPPSTVLSQPPPSASAPAPRPAPAPAPRAAPPPAPTPAAPMDLNALLAAAVNKDAAAQQKLQDMALAAGVSQAQIDAAADWPAVAALINQPAAAPPASDAGAFVPAVKDVYYYKPIDGKTGKPFWDAKTKAERKGIECEVIAVDQASLTVTMLNGDDKRTQYPNVSYDVASGKCALLSGADEPAPTV